MKKFYFLLLLSSLSYGQHSGFEEILSREFEAGHFNGSVLLAENDRIVAEKYLGKAEFRFGAPITSHTRIPIASVTKLLTTCVVLKLQEAGLINLTDTLDRYLSGLSLGVGKILISDLLLHTSGLQNEPIEAYLSSYSIDQYISRFVTLDEKSLASFNYNNVDYIILSKVIEVATQMNFQDAVKQVLLDPLKLKQTGFVDEQVIIPNLAYGYHNYSFGTGKVDDPLYPDERYISNYYGAGQMYSSVRDLYKLFSAIRENRIFSEKTKEGMLIRAQDSTEIDWLKGKPTYGFYLDEARFAQPVLRRSGSIDGYNASIIATTDFNRILIILCNTDTADLDSLAEEIYKEGF